MASNPSKAGTYGYDPSGKQIYDPGSYDIYGEYMGQRGQADKRTNFWQVRGQGYAAPTAEERAGGMSYDRWRAMQIKNIAPRPPSPDDVAPRGTPEWRQAVRTQRDWQNTVAKYGGSRADMGIQPAKGKGLAGYSRLGSGEGSLLEGLATRGRQDWQRWNERNIAAGKEGGMYDKKFGPSWRDDSGMSAFGGGYGGYDTGMGAGGQGSIPPGGGPAAGDSPFWGQSGGQPAGGGSLWGGGGGVPGGPGFYAKSTDPNQILLSSMGQMNVNRAQAAPVEQGLTGIYENILSGGKQGQAYLAPISQGIMQDVEGQRKQILATMPPGGQRDKALADLSEAAQGKMAQARQGLIGQATQGLTDIYQKNKFYSDPLAQQALQAGTQVRTTQMSLANQMKIAQMQNEMQRYGIDMSAEQAANQLGLGYAQLGQQGQQFGQNLAWQQSQFGQNLGWEQSKFGQGMTWEQSKYAQDLAERQREFDLAQKGQKKGFWGTLGGALGGIAGAATGGLFTSLFKPKTYGGQI